MQTLLLLMQSSSLTCDDAIVWRFQHGSIKLNDVLVTQNTQDLGLHGERERE
jgi:hypothetical protein